MTGDAASANTSSSPGRSALRRIFDADYYRREAEKRSLSIGDPLEHFLSVGWRLGLNPCASFDVQNYFVQNPDAERSALNPLVHYLINGKGGDQFPLAPTPTIQRTEDRAPAQAPNTGAIELGTPRTKNAAEEHAATRLAFPKIQTGDGRRIASIRINADHFWYDDHNIAEFLDRVDETPALPPRLRRLLIITYDFRMQTGVSRSLAHYVNSMVARGGYEFTSLELAPNANLSVATIDADAHDFVIVNSVVPFFRHEGAIPFMRRYRGKAALYLHETQWVFEKLKLEHPQRFQEFIDALPEFNLICVSQAQQRWLRDSYGAKNSAVVYESTTLPAPVPRHSLKESLDPRSPLQIVMAGTVQARKGAELFSRVADLACQAGLPWRFRWAGRKVGNKPIYQSTNVEWVGELDAPSLFDFLTKADIFFLSSADDPFPLCVLEALQASKRCVVYHATGAAELFEGQNGTAGTVFQQHTPQAALDALRHAASTACNSDSFSRINSELSLSSFAARLHNALSQFHTRAPPLPAPNSSRQKIAAIVHLFYHDLWPEIARALENLRDFNVDLYITLTSDKPRGELDLMRARIVKRWPNAVILECENRGMDIGPFVEVVRHLNQSDKVYDLVVKLHSKKSLAASGEVLGAQWRKDLYEGLLGTPTDIARVLSLFSAHDEIGMIGPRGMLLDKSSADTAAGHEVNAPSMRLLADRMGLSDRRQLFFRGTMFWARAQDVLEPIVRGNISLADFEPGYQSDNSSAHAFERLFACMTRSAGRELFQYDPSLPKPLRLLRDRHQGEDIYIVASGASAGFLDPSFLEDKVVLGVNRVFVRFPCTYVMFKEYADADYEQELLQANATPIVAQWDSGNIKQGKARRNSMSFKRPEYYFFEHLENTRDVVDLSVIAPACDKLVVSYSTITSAMHLAAYMGAKNIILIGHDCGLLDGKANFDGYYRDMTITPWKDPADYRAWLDQIESQTLLVREKIKLSFGCNVVSLNPFVNIGLEGHAYHRGK